MITELLAYILFGFILVALGIIIYLLYRAIQEILKTEF